MPTIGLVLGAGGVVGQAFHAGVLAAVVDMTGWDPRTAGFLVGTSAGSVAAAALRAGLSAGDLYARASGSPLSQPGQAMLDRSPSPAGSRPVSAATGRSARLGPSSPELLGRLLARPRGARAALAVTALLPEGRRDTTAWFAVLDAWYPGRRWPDAADGRLWVCAVDLATGDRVVFGRDPAAGRPDASVAEAVGASCAIPAIFRPVVIGGRRFVDGGVHSPTNADLLASEPLDAVVVSSPMSASRLRPGTPFSLDHVRAATRLPARRALGREQALIAAAGIPVLTFEPTVEVLDEMGLQPMDFRRRAPVAEAARAAARALLDSPEASEVARLLGGAAS